ncbi:MAG TPA: hypothetical protein VLC28_07335, partial [Flavitalea sp.]|nr:hypothetical protein [Flavitalea sp.]
MSHPLDNPIWNALNSGNNTLAYGTGSSMFIKRDVGFFAGLKDNIEEDLRDLYQLLPVKSVAVLFTVNDIPVPSCWEVRLRKELLQMVYQSKQPVVMDKNGIVTLGEENIPSMLELTSLTKPGPFLERTI